MDARQAAIAEDCMNAGHAGTMSFPEIVGTLTAAGFEGYAVDFRRHGPALFLPDGGSVIVATHPSDGAVAARFDPAGIAAQVAWAQANPPDYSYAAFCRNVQACGCAGYMVSFPRPARPLLRPHRRDPCRAFPAIAEAGGSVRPRPPATRSPPTARSSGHLPAVRSLRRGSSAGST